MYDQNKDERELVLPAQRELMTEVMTSSGNLRKEVKVEEDEDGEMDMNADVHMDVDAESGSKIPEEPQPLEVMFVTAKNSPSKRRRPVNARLHVVKSEYLSRLRQDQIQRILLPDAPPRRKQTRMPSPERDPCSLPEDPLTSTAADLLQVPTEEEDEFGTELTSTKNKDAMPSASSVAQKVEINTPPKISQPSTSHRSSLNAKNKKLFEPTLDNWQEDNDSDVDYELNLNDNDDGLLPDKRNAATEPACNGDLTDFERRVLETEDELSDRVLRDMVLNNDYLSFDWKKDSSNFTGQRETFSGTSGPTFNVTGKTPVDIFYEMFDKDFIDLLCRETNRYAEQKIASLKSQKKLLPSSRLHRWTPTDHNEIITFLAVLILQGLHPIPEEEKYFSYNGFGTMPYFSRIMSYNRFSLLKTLLHFVNNENLTDKTKLCKIRPLIDYFNDKFSTLYMPSQDISIDESLLKWHGRLSFSQKIATKAAHVGVKTYELCESRTGYLWKFFVYSGKSTLIDPTNNGPTDDVTIDRHDDETVDALEDETVGRPQNEAIDRPDKESHDRLETETRDQLQDETVDRPSNRLSRPTNATAKIVFDLVEPLLDRGHTLIMDNFYNSPLLSRCLKKNKTDCYGTIRLNREFVPDSLKTLTKTDLRQGEVVASYTSDLSVIVWRDAKLVSLISTYHPLHVATQNKYGRLTYKPKVVLDYNKSMGGVDRKDQFLSAQPIERARNKVWYKKVFRKLLNTAVFNAYVIFSSKNPKVSHRQFRTTLAEGLLKIHRRIDLTAEPRLFMSKNGTEAVVRKGRQTVDHDHFPARSDIKRARCYMCTRQKKDARTIWKCIACNVSLCIEHCFREYHKKEVFKTN